MVEISRYVQGPYNGVSQSPPQVRLEGTCEAMEDCIAIIPNGLQKRPPFALHKVLPGVWPGANPLFASIPRGSDLLDLTLVLDRQAGSTAAYLFQTYDFSTVPITVTPAAQTYLNTGSPSPGSDFRIKTIADTTFITNRQVSTATSGDTEATRPNEAIIWVKIGGYSRLYSVTVIPSVGSPVTAQYQPSTGSSGNDSLGVGTDRIAKGLFDGTIPASSSAAVAGSPLNTLIGAGFTVTLDGSTIYISHPTTTFTISVSDDQGGTAMTAIKDSVQRFSDLPAVARNGFVVRIAQEAAGGNSDYFVKFEATTSTTGGVWAECLEPGTELGLDPLTMPIGLKQVGGVWTLDTLPWKARTTGNPELSPDPDFLDQPIYSVSWYRGRLALVSDESIYLSSSADPFRFYTSTLAVTLDSDPIGQLTPADEKTFFRELGVFDKRLFAFAEGVQTLTSSDGPPTPSNTQTIQVANAPYTGHVPPQGVAKKIYFATRTNNATYVQELSIDRISGLEVVENMCVSVPDYLPPTLNMASSYPLGYMTVYAEAGDSRIYVHTFRHSNQQQVQNCWSAWNMPAGYAIHGFYFKQQILYAFVVNSTTNVGYVLLLDMSQGLVDNGGGTVLTYLDFKIFDVSLPAPVWSAANQTTTYTLPYPSAGAIASVRGEQSPTDPYQERYAPVVTARSGFTITLQGDWRTTTLCFGLPFTSYVIPSEFFQIGADEKTVLTGDLRLQTIHLDLTAPFVLDVTTSQPGRQSYTVPLEGNFVDSTLYDDPQRKHTMRRSVPINGDSPAVTLRFSNSSHIGFTLTGYEWVGDWTQRGVKRVS